MLTKFNKNMKHKVGDVVILNELFGKDCGKEATIHSIVTYKNNKTFYRLLYKGKLDPYDWLDIDFK